ncbi:MAG: cupin domain-containing protein [Chloroflexota bacterium]|nr:cupin domain-containing protein [Chloroflexota bacterium]
MPREHPRRPPRQRFAGTEHLFDLEAESERLRAEADGPGNGHRQITLFRGGGVSIVLFDFEPGGWLRDHAADGYVTVQVLSGEIHLTTAEQQYRMPAGRLLVLRPGVTHDVRAEPASRMLLTVRLDPAQDDRP